MKIITHEVQKLFWWKRDYRLSILANGHFVVDIPTVNYLTGIPCFGETKLVVRIGHGPQYDYSKVLIDSTNPVT